MRVLSADVCEYDLYKMLVVLGTERNTLWLPLPRGVPSEVVQLRGRVSFHQDINIRRTCVSLST
jgi:hypothetical protein